MSSATELSPGLIEVDEELMWCTQIDPDANVVYVSVRGIYGSTAASHASGAIARNQPRFPRVTIMRAINDTLRAVYPDLFAVATTELTSNLATATYELPANVELVLEVSYDDDDGTSYWTPLRRYDVNMHANTDVFTTGKSLTIFEPMESGHAVNVTYRKVPTAMSSLTDEFATVTGLPESAKECIVYGACARLVGYTETARTNDDAAEARFIDGNPAGQALNAARYFY